MHACFNTNHLFQLNTGLVNRNGADLLKTHRGKKSGTKIMYRLHQAMAFLVQFFINVRVSSHSPPLYLSKHLC